MDSNTRAADIASMLSYLSSISLFWLDGTLRFFDAHAGAIGAMVALSTFLVNCHYQRKRYKAELLRISNEEGNNG